MTVRAIVYDEGGTTIHDDAEAALAAPGRTWVRLAAPSDAEIDAVRAAAGLHPLAIEDVRNNVRPKVEEFDRYTFVLVKAARLTRGESTFEDEVAEEPVGLFVGDDWLVTIAADEPAAVEKVWAGVERADGRLLERGPDFAAYRVIDALVDGYFDILGTIEERIERIEDELVETPGRETLVDLNGARRELLSLRKVLWPSREAVGVLARGDPPQIREPTEKYYRDVYDHLVQLVDLAETYRDLAAGARDIYLNALSASTNEVMKRLTVVATVILPLTFVAGVFGMNFGNGPYNMPELGWTHGYPAAMLGMVATALVLVWHFRHEGYL